MAQENQSRAVATAEDNPPASKPALQAGGNLTAIIPQDAEQAFRMAQMIHQSRMAPRDMNQPEQIVAAIFHGAEIGLPPMQAVQSIAVVNGRPTVWGDAAIGLVEASGLLEDFEETTEGEGERMIARCRAKRKGRASEITRTFSVEDAKAAGLWGKQGPWKQYPKRMLQMRARSWVLRDGFADVLKGLSVREEVQDFGRGVVIDAQEPETPKATAKALLQQAGQGAAAEPEKPETPCLPENFDPDEWVKRMFGILDRGKKDPDGLVTFMSNESERVTVRAMMDQGHSGYVMEVDDRFYALTGKSLPDAPPRDPEPAESALDDGDDVPSYLDEGADLLGDQQ